MNHGMRYCEDHGNAAEEVLVIYNSIHCPICALNDQLHALSVPHEKLKEKIRQVTKQLTEENKEETK